MVNQATMSVPKGRAVAGAIYLYQIESDNLTKSIIALAEAQEAFQIVNPEADDPYPKLIKVLEKQSDIVVKRLTSLTDAFKAGAY